MLELLLYVLNVGLCPSVHLSSLWVAANSSILLCNIYLIVWVYSLRGTRANRSATSNIVKLLRKHLAMKLGCLSFFLSFFLVCLLTHTPMWSCYKYYGNSSRMLPLFWTLLLLSYQHYLHNHRRTIIECCTIISFLGYSQKVSRYWCGG